MELLCPDKWIDYELIDCGGFEKLERFGDYILIRPEPQAIWDKTLSDNQWKEKAHALFIGKSSNSGIWKKLKKMPDQWTIQYTLAQNILRFRLGLTAFKHVGLFPEQAVNWEFIHESVKKIGKKPKVLNLFAYTGASSLAAKAAGADVTHVDSIKQVVNWARENMEKSQLTEIRWIVEDAVKFVQRELRRGNLYQGIILDPPAFGHGPNGESWKLEKDINELLKNVYKLCDPSGYFLLLNTYSLGFSSIIVENLSNSIFIKKGKTQTGELYINDSFGKKLPLGVFVQMQP